ncbi:hypothetical protein CMV_012676 [Castanea mollissima]|uniref:Prefoldin subunit 4 n=1 Tax=Castanea mollissima TaxID=60419 RepID=A0A8J4RGZ3_9ROSI|nr:hypothetical protein CMV_012676 [Castanea mollissima]
MSSQSQKWAPNTFLVMLEWAPIAVLAMLVSRVAEHDHALVWQHFAVQDMFGDTSLGSGGSNENLEDASNELILTNDDVVRFQIGEVFAHVSKDEVEARIEQMKEVTSKNLEKLEEEKDSVVAQMAELKKILYGKFNDSINLEED